MQFRQILALLTLVAAIVLWRLLAPLNDIRPDLGTENCKRLGATELIGSEDLTIDHQAGLAYISAIPRFRNKKAQAAGIYVMDLKDPNRSISKLELKNFTLPIEPHGISLWRSPNESSEPNRLFVIDHANSVDVVHIFAIHSDHLFLLDTIRSHLFVSPNDLVAVGPTSFYITCDVAAANIVAKVLLLTSNTPYGFVIFHDGTSTRIALRGLNYANGIQLSLDGTEIYVAELRAQKVNQYRIRPTGGLELIASVQTNTGVDNIELDPRDGTLYVACTWSVLKFLRYLTQFSDYAPSQVLQFSFNEEHLISQAKEVFFSETIFATSSTAAPFIQDGHLHLLIGTVMDSGVLECSY